MVLQVNQDLHFRGGIVLNLSDLDLARIIGLYNTVHQPGSSYTIWHTPDGKGLLVHFFNMRTHFHFSAPHTLVVVGYIGHGAIGKVRIKIKLPTLQVFNGSIAELTEIMG